MKLCVASPYPLSELKGNTVTTERIVALLRAAGHAARASHLFDGEDADVLIALHAVKGAPAVFEFRKKFPRGKVVILITGTDLYESLPAGSEVGERALEMADRIVVVQEAAVRRFAESLREKVRVIPASLDPIMSALPEKRELSASSESSSSSSCFAISVLGHPRAVKRPFLTIEAIAKHPEWSDLEVWQIGEALDPESRERGREWVARDSRYRWFGGLAREEALALCAKSALTVNSSILEGGANAIVEAMTMGVPILASRIEGNVGLLGEDYAGYFEEGKLDEAIQVARDRRFQLQDWVAQASARLPLFSPESETASWLELLDELNYQETSS